MEQTQVRVLLGIPAPGEEIIAIVIGPTLVSPVAIRITIPLHIAFRVPDAKDQPRIAKLDTQTGGPMDRVQIGVTTVLVEAAVINGPTPVVPSGRTLFTVTGPIVAPAGIQIPVVAGMMLREIVVILDTQTHVIITPIITIRRHLIIFVTTRT